MRIAKTIIINCYIERAIQVKLTWMALYFVHQTNIINKNPVYLNRKVSGILLCFSVAREIRTLDLRFRRPLLYPAELLRQINTNNYMKY